MSSTERFAVPVDGKLFNIRQYCYRSMIISNERFTLTCARDPISRDRDRDRDVDNSLETRPRRDLGYVSRPSRDRDVETETTSLLSVRRFKPAAVRYSYRNIKGIDMTAFEERLLASRIVTDPPASPDEFVDLLDHVVADILDELAPVRHGNRPFGRKSARWLSEEAISAKRLRRRLERRWKSTGADVDRVAYRKACCNANTLINTSRNQHRYQRIMESNGDSRRVWSAVKDLLHGEVTSDGGTTEENAAFCTSLASFFINKVRNIKTNIAASLNGRLITPLSSDVACDNELSEFSLVTETEVLRILSSMPSKSSPLDTVPTSLLKACSGAFSRIIASLANITFQCGSFPTKFKLAQITPLLKQQGLDATSPSSYRPISNLNTISKILERLVLTRITSHANSSAVIDSFQSAYRQGHSTETALLRVTNDVFEAFDAGRSVLLVALDLSAAFDCIDHRTLIDRLQYTFGLTGLALDWLRSYMNSRFSFVKWKSCTSDRVSIDTGIAQGSSLGPKLFSMYIAPLARLIRSSGVQYHQYADDTQLYISVSRNDVDVNIATLERCIVDVHEWLLHNGLALNPTKSDAIQFVTGRGRSRVDDVTSLDVSGAAIQPAATVKSLGVVLDRQLSFDQHVNNVCRACYYHIRALRHVRDSLPDDVAKTVAVSIVTSRLDYCNALYCGMSSSNFDKLQRVQNTLARVILKQHKFVHVTPLLVQLHWLPIRQRVTFKLATLTFKLIHSHQPSYLFELIDMYQPVRYLRSSDLNLLCAHRTRTVLATRAFKHSAVAVWNNLLPDIRNCETLYSFKRRLKTVLFRAAFNIA